jgi:hypothetical protein
MMLKIHPGNACMKSVNEAVSFCRHCRFYRAEGRRGGHCGQLEVPVQGSWKACPLAVAPFNSTWKELVEMSAWQMADESEAGTALDLPLQTVSLTDTPAIAVMLPTEETLLGVE